MKRTVIYILCAALILSFCSCAASDFTPEPPVAPSAVPTPESTQAVFTVAKYKLVCIGDSIASGFALSNSASQRFSVLLAEMLSASGEGWSEYNYAVPGHAGSDMVSLINKDGAPELENADIIAVCIGANNVLKPANSFLLTYAAYCLGKESGEIEITSEDIRTAYSDFRSKAQAGAESLRSELTHAMEYIRSINPDARVILMTVYNPYKTNTTEIDIAGLPIPMNVMSDTFVSLINEVIIAESENLGYEVTDVYSAFEAAEDSLINGDGAQSFIADPHPNASGHQLIAETYYGIIVGAA